MFLAELLAEIILNIGLEYIYPLICYRIKKLLSHQAGGTQQHINKQNIENLLILSPCGRCVKRIHKTGKSFIGLYLKNIYSDGELSKEATTEEFSVVLEEGDRNITRNRLNSFFTR